jgi:hypothetical protein
MAVGEQTQFEPGQRAPNEGKYMEVGEDSFHMNITNPQHVELRKGQPFPETTNHNRKWKKVKQFH